MAKYESDFANDRAADADLVRVALEKDQAAFEALALRYYPLVEAYARQLLEDPDLAQDIAQEAFLLAYRELNTLRRPETFGVWLKSITWRACRNWVRAQQAARKAKQHLQVNETDCAMPPDPYLEEDASAPDPWLERLATTLDGMDQGKKAVLTLFYVQGLPYTQIAQFLDVPLGTVKRRLHSGRQAVARAASDVDRADEEERKRFVATLRQWLSKKETL